MDNTQLAERAMSAGIQLARFAEQRGVSILYPENVRGLVRKSDFVVPHSESAMHQKAAGAQLLAWAQHRDGSAAIVFYSSLGPGNREQIGYAQGTPHEVLPRAVSELMSKERAWSHGHGDSRGTKRTGNFRRDMTQATLLRLNHEVLRRLVRDHRISEPDAEELLSRRAEDVEEMLSAKVKPADIARSLATSAY